MKMPCRWKNAAHSSPPGARTSAAPAKTGAPQFVLNQEFQPVIQQFRLPFALFDELIQGCEMDLDKLRYETL